MCLYALVDCWKVLEFVEQNKEFTVSTVLKKWSLGPKCFMIYDASSSGLVLRNINKNARIRVFQIDYPVFLQKLCMESFWVAFEKLCVRFSCFLIM